MEVVLEIVKPSSNSECGNTNKFSLFCVLQALKMDNFDASCYQTVVFDGFRWVTRKGLLFMHIDSPEVGKGTLSARCNSYVYEDEVESLGAARQKLPYPALNLQTPLGFAQTEQHDSNSSS